MGWLSPPKIPKFENLLLQINENIPYFNAIRDGPSQSSQMFPPESYHDKEHVNPSKPSGYYIHRQA
jgi:hypothetical protein